MQRNSKIDERGATAIEYAIIAGLIGLGLVGSLVATRGSLSTVFGTASSQMGSANQAGASAPLPGRAGYWSSKGLVSQSTSGTNTTFRYGDGSVVTLILAGGGASPHRVYAVDASQRVQRGIAYDDGMVLNGFTLTNYAADMQSIQTQLFSSSTDITNGSVNRVWTDTYSNGKVVSETSAGPTAAFLAEIGTSNEEFAYFKSLVK